jgi:hypothetical protein
MTGMFTLKDVPEDQNVVMIATGTGLAPYISMLRTHLDGVLAWTKARVSNGAVEGMNNKIKSISHRSFGFRSAKYFIVAIYYYWVTKEHFVIELFCGITPLRARPTRTTLRGIYRGPGDSRGARRPAHTAEELLQGVAVTR